MKHFVLLALVLAVSSAVFGQQIANNLPPDLLARDTSSPAASPAEWAQPLPAAKFLTVAAEPPSLNTTTEALAFTPIARPVEQKPVFHKKVFISEVAAYTVANVLDGITTVRGVRRGFTESSWPRGSAELLGTRPGIGRYAATMGAMEVGAAFISYRLQHSQNRYLRLMGHSFLLEGTVDHSLGSANNLALPSHPALQ
ncbi:MAG TPA: hypothetical protein VKW06_13775 [Candidatus Angelobacter sp.]|nr:hypothetical protein [Candidatus Angelobacter sp.]